MPARSSKHAPLSLAKWVWNPTTCPIQRMQIMYTLARKIYRGFKHLTQAAWILSISFQFLLRVPTSHALFRSFWLILNANLYNPPAVHIACPPNTVIFSPHFSLTHLHYAVGVWQGQWIKARQTFPWADTTPKKWAGQVFISPPKD